MELVAQECRGDLDDRRSLDHRLKDRPFGEQVPDSALQVNRLFVRSLKVRLLIDVFGELHDQRPGLSDLVGVEGATDSNRPCARQ